MVVLICKHPDKRVGLGRSRHGLALRNFSSRGPGAAECGAPLGLAQLANLPVRPTLAHGMHMLCRLSSFVYVCPTVPYPSAAPGFLVPFLRYRRADAYRTAAWSSEKIDFIPMQDLKILSQVGSGRAGAIRNCNELHGQSGMRRCHTLR